MVGVAPSSNSSHLVVLEGWGAGAVVATWGEGEEWSEGEECGEEGVLEEAGLTVMQGVLIVREEGRLRMEGVVVCVGGGEYQVTREEGGCREGRMEACGYQVGLFMISPLSTTFSFLHRAHVLYFHKKTAGLYGKL